MSDAGSVYSTSSTSSPTSRAAEAPKLGAATRDDRMKAKDALVLRQTIAETVRLAFKEKDASKEAQNERLEQKRMKERMLDLSTKLSSCMNVIQEMKKDKTVELLQEKLDKSNAQIKELKKENKAMAEKFNQQIERLEEKLDGALNSERTKRLGLFNRWAKKHAEDVESLRMSVEESLTHIDERSNREWEKQGKTLDVLREKIDIALIRRLGYLPITNANAGFPDFHSVAGLGDHAVAVEEASAHSMSASNVSGEEKVHDMIKEEPAEDLAISQEDDVALQSKISSFFAYGPPKKGKLDMDLGVDPEYLRVEASGSKSPLSSPNATKACIRLVRPPTPASSVESGALFNQGLDAHNVIDSMENRISEVARHVEQLNKARLFEAAGKDLVAERSRRMRQLRRPSSGLSSDDDYPGSDERDARYGLALEFRRGKVEESSGEEEAKHRKKQVQKNARSTKKAADGRPTNSLHQ